MYVVDPKILLMACQLIGSQAKLARHLGIRRERLNNWINRGDRVAYEYLLAIEVATAGKITFQQLVPEFHFDKNIPEPTVNETSSARLITQRLSSLETNLQKKLQKNVLEQEEKIERLIQKAFSEEFSLQRLHLEKLVLTLLEKILSHKEGKNNA